MHPNRTLTNKISMIILNLEVVYCFRIFAFFNDAIRNNQIIAVNAYKGITNKKISCVDKASVLDVERVVNDCNDFFAVYGEMYKLVYLAYICFKNGFLRCVICVGIC